MATTNRERIDKALDLLRGGLGPVVERELTSTKDGAAAELSRLLGEDRLNARKPNGTCRFLSG
jgi:hypothetical protein